MNNIKVNLVSVVAIFMKFENLVALLYDQSNTTSEMKLCTVYNTSTVIKPCLSRLWYILGASMGDNVEGTFLLLDC
jgi:hypothetical protein